MQNANNADAKVQQQQGLLQQKPQNGSRVMAKSTTMKTTTTTMTGEKVKTRILIISDTHNRPLQEDEGLAFREPLPDADVCIHCGYVILFFFLFLFFPSPPCVLSNLVLPCHPFLCFPSSFCVCVYIYMCVLFPSFALCSGWSGVCVYCSSL